MNPQDPLTQAQADLDAAETAVAAAQEALTPLQEAANTLSAATVKRDTALAARNKARSDTFDPRVLANARTLGINPDYCESTDELQAKIDARMAELAAENERLATLDPPQAPMQIPVLL